MSAYDIANLIIAVLGALVILQNVWDFVHTGLPSHHLQQLEDVTHDADFSYNNALEEGLVFDQFLRHRIESRLASVSSETIRLRGKVLRAQGLSQQILAKLCGLCTQIIALTAEAEDLRAQITTAAECQRRKLEREARIVKPSVLGPTLYLPPDPVPEIPEYLLVTPPEVQTPRVRDKLDRTTLPSYSVLPPQLSLASAPGVCVPELSLPCIAYIPKEVIVPRPVDYYVPDLPYEDPYSKVTDNSSSFDSGYFSFTGEPQDTDLADQDPAAKAETLTDVIQRLRDNVARLSIAVANRERFQAKAASVLNGAADILQKHPILNEVQDMFLQAHLTSAVDEPTKG